MKITLELHETYMRTWMKNQAKSQVTSKVINSDYTTEV